MTNKTNKKKKAQPAPQEESVNTRGNGITSSGATIIAAIIGLVGISIGAVLSYQSEQEKLYVPIYISQTAQSISYTQTALAFSPNTLPLSTPSFTPAPLTESPTPYPEPSLNIKVPTRDEINLVSPIDIDYLDIPYPGTQTYKVKVSSKSTYLWSYRWCALHQGTLDDNIDQIKISFFIDNIEIPDTQFFISNRPDTTTNWPCQRWITMLSGWDPAQSHTLSVVYYIGSPLSDGVSTYPIGEYRHDIIVDYTN